jgi:hypothetical protein
LYFTINTIHILTPFFTLSTLNDDVLGGNSMHMSIGVLIISVLLFFVLAFGIGFLLNMVLRMYWILAFIYPIITILIVDKVRFVEYFTNSDIAFQALIHRFSSLGNADIIILSSGFIGAILAGIAMKLLRKKGYQMF